MLDLKIPSLKTCLSIGAVLFAIILLISNTYIIKDTEVGVKVRLGAIQPEVVTTGVAFTIPFIEDIRLVDTTEQKQEYPGISLATKADAASPAKGNIVITFAIVGSEAPSILEEFGTVDRFIDTRLTQPMYSQARIQAAAFEDTRTLMKPQSRTKLGVDLQNVLDASTHGYDVRNVMVQSIIPHVTIADRINKAAQRAEADVIEQHNIKLAKSVALTATAQAEGAEQVANAEARARAFEVTAKADAEAHAILAKANAERDGMFALAEGNTKLSQTLTKDILRKQELDNQLVLYKQSKGAVPASVTVLNSGDLQTLGFPFALK